MQLTITKTTNGYLLRWPEEDEEGRPTFQEAVIEEQETSAFSENLKTSDPEKVAMGRLLGKVADLLGYTYQKWEEGNLSIKFDLRGHKLDVDTVPELGGK